MLGIAVTFLGTQVTAGRGQGVPAYWGGLRAGEFGVGFRVVQAVDHARGYRPRVDYRGRVSPGETGRPIQLTIWYPAQTEGRAPLRFGDYIDAAARELGDSGDVSGRRAYVVAELRGGPLRPHFPSGVPDSALTRIERMAVRAARDAPPLGGPFPVLIHAGIGGGLTQSVLLEYLASHGYIVVGTPLLGSGPAWYGRGEWTAEALAEGADDVGFVLSWLRGLPAADLSRVAVIGMGAHAGLLFEMRQMRLAALALVEATTPAALRDVPGYGVERVRIPVLETGNTEFARDLSIVDSLRYAERYRLQFREATHAAFYQFPRVAHPHRAADHMQYEAVARYALAFFDAVLKRHEPATAFLRGGPAANGLPASYLTLRVEPGLLPSPTEAEFLALIREGRMDEAVRAYSEVKAREPEHRIFAEARLRTLLRFLARDAGAAAALPGAELLVDAYPRVVAARELLGVLHRQTGNDDAALRELQAALTLIDEDPTLTPTERERARSALRRQIAR